MLFSKSALATALAATGAASVTADSFRGPAILDLDQLPSPDVHCHNNLHDSFNCSGAKSSNGDHCVWCQVSKDTGACLSQSDAGYVMTNFQLPCPDYTALLKAKEEEKMTANIPDFMCLLASSDEELCEQRSASDGSKCLWCDGTNSPSFCFANKDAAFINNKFGLECAANNEDVAVDEEEVEVSDEPNIDPGLFDFKCIMAAWNADDAEDACADAHAGDGSECVWCQTQGDSMGVCLHSKQAEYADGNYGLSCPSEEVTNYIDTDRD